MISKEILTAQGFLCASVPSLLQGSYFCPPHSSAFKLWVTSRSDFSHPPCPPAPKSHSSNPADCVHLTVYLMPESQIARDLKP